MKTNRRKFIQNAGLSAAALGVTAPSLASANRETGEKDDQVLLIGDNIAVANTAYGKVKGFVLRGINTFLGIPYGADTSGANRFMRVRLCRTLYELNVIAARVHKVSKFLNLP